MVWWDGCSRGLGFPLIRFAYAPLRILLPRHKMKVRVQGQQLHAKAPAQQKAGSRAQASPTGQPDAREASSSAGKGGADLVEAAFREDAENAAELPPASPYQSSSSPGMLAASPDDHGRR